MPTLLLPTSLIWASVAFQEPEWALVPRLDWGGVQTPWQGALH